MDMCAKPADASLLNGLYIRIEWIRTGGIRVERIRIGGIRIGGIRFGWICVGYVWCDGYVWDMCGVRYANNLLKNPATKRLSGKIFSFFMKSDVGSLALLDINFSHGEERVFEMHLRLGPWMIYFFVFGSLGFRDLPFIFEDQCINFW